jgi:hypothetical protein
MATIERLNYTRFTKQWASDLLAILATEEAAKDAFVGMQAVPWAESSTESSNFAPRNALQTGSDTSYDAYKFVGDYAAGKQKAYAGCVAYRITIPQDALDLSSDITSVDVPVLVDRWLIDGIHVAAQVSSSAYPSESWDVIRAGDVALSAQLTGLTPKAEQSDTLTLTLPASTAALSYLYIYLTLEDYETFRGFWIEGGALVFGNGIVVETSEDAQTLQTPVVPARYYAPIMYTPLTVDKLDYAINPLTFTDSPDGPPRAADLVDYAFECSIVREGFLAAVSAGFPSNHYPEFTIAFWIRFAAGISAEYNPILLISASSDHVATNGIQVYHYNSGANDILQCILFGISASGSGAIFDTLSKTSPGLDDAAWHRVVIVYKKNGSLYGSAANADKKIYIDGASATSATTTNGFITGAGATALTNVCIGNPGTDPWYTQITSYRINDLVIDSVAWSAAEVSADYAAYRAMKPAPARVTNLAATPADTTATVTADMDELNKGTVVLFSGTTDGEDDPAAWDDSDDSEGLVSEERGDAISIGLTGLTAETEYFYRIRTTNEYGTFWSDTESFTTTA